jgi:hypothetical protein
MDMDSAVTDPSFLLLRNAPLALFEYEAGWANVVQKFSV